jgi:hypothetical protein
MGISRELAGRYYRRLMSLGYLKRIKRRRQGFVTRVNYTSITQQRMAAMANLDPQTIALGRKNLDKIAEQLREKGTRVRRAPNARKEPTQVPRTDDCINTFLMDV